MAEFHQAEDQDAVRLPWNVWPNSRIEAAKCVVPFAALYTPNKDKQDLLVVDYEPVSCKGCAAVLNPYASMDYHAQLWICPFCHQRNHFPAQYRGINEQQLPAELFPDYSTMEYRMQPKQLIYAPAFIFVVDTCLSEEELSASKAAILQALQVIPEYMRVGLVTFGTHVHVHELGFEACPKCYVFQGSKEYTPQGAVTTSCSCAGTAIELVLKPLVNAVLMGSKMCMLQLGIDSCNRAIQAQLAIGAHTAVRQPLSPAKGELPRPMDPTAAAAKRFILPLSDGEFMINTALEELQRDAFPAVADQRPSRCTGTAIQVAAGLAAGCLPQGSSAARIMLLVGGPATVGPGKVVDMELSEPIRSHKDLAKEAAPHWKRARRFYDSLAHQLVQQGHALDVFACSLDQVGLAEMKNAVERTGGLVLQSDTFMNPVFRESFRRVFAQPGQEGYLHANSNAQMEIICSKDIKIAGLLGSAAPLESKSSMVADKAEGMGGTNRWKMATLDSTTTVAAFFEIVANKGQQQQHQQFFLQFKTAYLNGEDGSLRMRVTSITRRWTEGSNLPDLIQNFDQEAAVVTIARLASHKMEAEEDFDATRWLDRTLIRLAARFGDYRKDDPISFTLQPQLSFLPQFMFNLRRSQFVQVFGNSPDETAYCRILLNRERAMDGILMLQPSLVSYSNEQPEQPEPVLLDVQSIQPDRMLLLDSYFYIVVWHGSTVADWRKHGYQDQPEFASFATMLQSPMEEARAIMKQRFPEPRLVVCDQNGSQARFLLAKLNPSSSYSNAAGMSSEVILTDDVSLDVFTDHLRKLAVQS